ncbi:MAG: sugar transporter permease [Bacillota bacterium]|jgi:multiple sugar transport system permease protein|nr:sugar transporter permease [Bacillota bacterium]
MKKRKSGFAYIMTSPTMLILIALSIFPLIFNIFYSFTDYYYLSRKDPSIIGMDNYANILKDVYFQQAVYNTVKFTILAVFFETLLGLGIALLVNSIQKGRKTMRTVSLLPTLLPPVTVALIWQIMFSNNYGIINKLLSGIGIDPVNWLMDVNTAFYAILVIDVWQYAPFAFLLIYASLQAVPQGQYEAARIDGAGIWQQFLYVTLPNIANGVIMVVLLRTIDTFRLFDKVNILTKGGPANSTATITQYIFQHGVKGLKVGYGSAAALIMTVIVLILAGAYIKKSFDKQKV